MTPPCAERSTGYHYMCTRDRGHDGAHIATDPRGRVLDTWMLDTDNEATT